VVSRCAANATAFSDGGVAPATAYWYRVRAFSGQVVSPWSSVAGNVTPGTPPAPSGLDVSAAGSFHVNVNWLSTAVYHTGFEVERSLMCSSTGFALVATVGPGETHLWDTVPAAQVTYCYRVRATSLAGPSGWSPEAQVLMPPSPPPDLQATATGPATVDLRWGGTPGPGIWFDVQHRVVGSGWWINSVTTSWIIATISGLAPSTTYEFRVFVAAAGGRSDPSAVATATTLPGP
jgi:titin